MGNKKGHCLYLNPDFVLGVQSCGITNLSEFVNLVLEEIILLDQPDYSPQKQAKIIAEKVRKQVVYQRKLIEEEKSYEDQAKESYQKFTSEATKLLKNIRSLKSKLPENDVYGDCSGIWSKYADVLTKKCGFTVTEAECMTFVRQEAV